MIHRRYEASADACEPDADGAGFSAHRLGRLDSIVQGYVDKGDIPGAIVLIARRGLVAYHRAFGSASARARPSAALRTDTIFWLASMTKPLVATAVLMLLEEGKLRLEDCASRFIPEFCAPRMVRSFEPGTLEGGCRGTVVDEPPHTLVPATGEVTVKGLLTHTAGLQSVGVPNRAIPPIGDGDTVAEWVPRLAGVPLDFQPGSRWAYSNAVGFEVLVRIVEVASGRRIDEFLRDRLFEPLGMRDSGFGMQHRSPERALPLHRKLAENPCVAGTRYHCGSAGLWMTASDYWRFAQMLANGGAFAGSRVLSPESVRLMATDHTRGLFSGWRDIDGAGAQMGLSVLVVLDPAAAGLDLPAGSFGWDGIGTRRFWVVPAEEMVLIMLMPAGNAESAHRAIERAAMDAIAR